MEIKPPYSALRYPAYACKCPGCDSVYQWGLVQHPLVEQTQTLKCQFCGNTAHVIWTGARWKYYEPQPQYVPSWRETRWESYYLVWLLKGMRLLRQRVADTLARAHRRAERRDYGSISHLVEIWRKRHGCGAQANKTITAMLVTWGTSRPAASIGVRDIERLVRKTKPDLCVASAMFKLGIESEFITYNPVVAYRKKCNRNEVKEQPEPPAEQSGLAIRHTDTLMGGPKRYRLAARGWHREINNYYGKYFPFYESSGMFEQMLGCPT